MLSIKYSAIRQNCRNSFITVPWFFTVLHSETCCPSGFTVCENMFRLDLYCTIPWRIIKPCTLSQKLSESPYKNRTYEGWSRCNGILVTGFWTYCIAYRPLHLLQPRGKLGFYAETQIIFSTFEQVEENQFYGILPFLCAVKSGSKYLAPSPPLLSVPRTI